MTISNYSKRNIKDFKYMPITTASIETFAAYSEIREILPNCRSGACVEAMSRISAGYLHSIVLLMIATMHPSLQPYCSETCNLLQPWQNSGVKLKVVVIQECLTFC